MWPSASAQIQTSFQAGGIARALIRWSTSSSSIRSPVLPSMYSNPLPRRRRVMPGAAQSTRLRPGRVQQGSPGALCSKTPAKRAPSLEIPQRGQMGVVRASYVLPIRWSDEAGFEDLTRYLRGLPDWLEPVIVDGSPEPLFKRHSLAWAELGRHLRPDPSLETPMGKVGGVLTGIREA